MPLYPAEIGRRTVSPAWGVIMTIPTSVDAARLTRIRFAALGSAALVLLGAVAVAPAHPGVPTPISHVRHGHPR